MGMRISNEQAEAAAEHAANSINERFGGSDVQATVEHHNNAYKINFITLLLFCFGSVTASAKM